MEAGTAVDLTPRKFVSGRAVVESKLRSHETNDASREYGRVAHPEVDADAGVRLLNPASPSLLI
jgi:hypothetical protein